MGSTIRESLHHLTWPQLYAALEAGDLGAETEYSLRLTCAEFSINRDKVTPSFMVAKDQRRLGT